MTELTILVECGPGGVPPTLIDVQWEERLAPLPAHAAAHLDARWNHYLEDAQRHHKSLFNGPITRLLHAERRDQRVLLRLGPADYKTFVVTCLRDRPWFEAHAPEAMTPALGNSVLLTHGDEAFLGIRSPRVSAYASRAHLVGGVLDALGTDRFPASTLGLLNHLEMELHEELHLSRSQLADAGPRLLGIARDEFLAQPEAIWHWEVTCPLEKIGAGLNLDEHAQWLALPRRHCPADLLPRMTPVARYAWRQWSVG